MDRLKGSASAQEFPSHRKSFTRQFHASNSLTTIWTNDFPPKFWRIAMSQRSWEDRAWLNPDGQGKTRFFLKFKAVSAGSEGKFKDTRLFPGIRGLKWQSRRCLFLIHALIHSTSRVPDTMSNTIPSSSHLGDRGYVTAGHGGQGKSGENTNFIFQQKVS